MGYGMQPVMGVQGFPINPANQPGLPQQPLAQPQLQG
jgi:hypothetical protein